MAAARDAELLERNRQVLHNCARPLYCRPAPLARDLPADVNFRRANRAEGAPRGLSSERQVRGEEAAREADDEVSAVFVTEAEQKHVDLQRL